MSDLIAEKYDGSRIAMESGTVVFQYRKEQNYAFHKSILRETDGIHKTYMEMMDRIRNDDIRIGHYFKRDDGDWVDLHELRRNRITGDLFAMANGPTGSQFIVDYKKIPDVEYVDSELNVHYIPRGDGKMNDSAPAIYIDCGYNGDVEIRQWNIEAFSDPSKGENYINEYPFLNQDLRVELKKDEYTSDIFLVWLNGVFVPTIQDPNDDKVFYIKNALSLYTTRVLDHEHDGTPKHRPNSETAKVVENVEGDIRRYNIDLRLFGWEDVSLGRWESVVANQLEPIRYQNRNIFLVNKVTFSKPASENHVIFENGVILHPNSYVIDEKDRRQVYFKNVIPRAFSILQQLISEGHPRPLDKTLEVYRGAVYGLVNFKTTNENIDHYIIRDRSGIPNHPYKREITFPWININDLIIVNGMYIPYVWEHRHTIRFPVMDFSNPLDDIEALRTGLIERITFHREFHDLEIDESDPPVVDDGGDVVGDPYDPEGELIDPDGEED